MNAIDLIKFLLPVYDELQLVCESVLVDVLLCGPKISFAIAIYLKMIHAQIYGCMLLFPSVACAKQGTSQI
jgi:hypothetical protein